LSGHCVSFDSDRFDYNAPCAGQEASTQFFSGFFAIFCRRPRFFQCFCADGAGKSHLICASLPSWPLTPLIPGLRRDAKNPEKIAFEATSGRWSVSVRGFCA
jgi:hypothetical protein